jgi:hypothetical protein
MFNKLSFEELANLYGSLATLEKHYGKEAVRDAMEVMSDRLDNQKKQHIGGFFPSIKIPELKIPDIPKINIDKALIKASEQIQKQAREMVPKQLSFDDTEIKRSREYKDREQKGHNDKKIREYFNDQDAEEGVIGLYYRDGKTQSEIGKMIGVNQRAVSRFLNRVPEKTKRTIMAGWTNE